MSMNLYIEAIGTVTAPNGEKLPYSEGFNLQQTSTEETYKVLDSEDKFEAYKSLKSTTKVKVKALKAWINKMTNLGFEITWYQM